MNLSNKFAKTTIIVAITLFVAFISLFLPQQVWSKKGEAVFTSTLGVNSTTTRTLLILSPTSSQSPTALTPTITPTPTPTTTPTITATSTPTPGPFPEPIDSSILLFIFLGLTIFLLGFLAAKYLRQLQLDKQTPKQGVKPPLDEVKPKQNFDPPIKGSSEPEFVEPIEPIALRDELNNGLGILRELYRIVSETQNRDYIPIKDLRKLLEEKYPDNPIDLEQIAIEIVNTKDGLLKIQESRYEGYLIKILYDENERPGT